MGLFQQNTKVKGFQINFEKGPRPFPRRHIKGLDLHKLKFSLEPLGQLKSTLAHKYPYLFTKEGPICCLKGDNNLLCLLTNVHNLLTYFIDLSGTVSRVSEMVRGPFFH